MSAYFAFTSAHPLPADPNHPGAGTETHRALGLNMGPFLPTKLAQRHAHNMKVWGVGAALK